MRTANRLLVMYQNKLKARFELEKSIAAPTITEQISLVDCKVFREMRVGYFDEVQKILREGKAHKLVQIFVMMQKHCSSIATTQASSFQQPMFLEAIKPCIKLRKDKVEER